MTRWPLTQIDDLIFSKDEGSKKIYVTEQSAGKQIGILDCVTADPCVALYKKDEEYVVIHSTGICEVFSCADFHRIFAQMLNTGFTGRINCPDDKICLTAEFHRYCLYERETTKTLQVRRADEIKSLDELFVDD